MYFDQLNLWEQFEKSTILHFAPEGPLSRKIKAIQPEKYVQADLFVSNLPYDKEVISLDVTDIKQPDKSFDFVICNHVLEHVDDEMAAMREIYRVLKKQGRAILQTPFSSVLRYTFQDPHIDTGELRDFFYWQDDHVRLFGMDFFDKLQEAGFSLQIKKNSDYFTNEVCSYHGVNPKEDLILVQKN